MDDSQKIVLLALANLGGEAYETDIARYLFKHTGSAESVPIRLTELKKMNFIKITNEKGLVINKRHAAITKEGQNELRNDPMRKLWEKAKTFFKE